MVEAIAQLNGFSASWAGAMWAIIWQSTLWAAAVAALLLAWRRLAPNLRCWAWRIVAIKMLVMPFWMVSVPAPDWPSTTPMPTAPVDRLPVREPGLANSVVTLPAASGVFSNRQAPAPAASGAGRHTKLSWQTWLATAWLAVISMQLIRLARQRQRLRVVLAAAQPADERICRLVTEGCQQLLMIRVPGIRITEAEVSPFVCNPARPILVLPHSITGPGCSFPLRQIVLHELAHVRRADLLWCWITHIARMVFWFHPVAHWVAFREALERELACDELAISHSGATAADYAQTLVETVSRVAHPAVLRAAAVHLDGGWSGIRQYSPSPGPSPGPGEG